MRVHADRDTCVGSGNCVFTDPDVFDQDDDGIVMLLTDRPVGEHETNARDAVDRCPSLALTITDE